MSTHDTPELEALFDEIAATSSSPDTASVPAESVGSLAGDEVQVFNHLGKLTRQLHDTLRELGYDRRIEDTAQSLPDVQQRLLYIAEKTELAASTTLAAVEESMPAQRAMQKKATALKTQWDSAFAGTMDAETFKTLAAKTRQFMGEVTLTSGEAHDNLHKIMMAMEFQDLTGQVVRRVAEVLNKVEKELLDLLLATVPEAARPAIESSGLLNGPAITPAADVLASQDEVDNLLESLGF